MIFLTELMPVILLSLRQNKDYLEVWRILPKPLYGAHKHWFACYGYELLGNVTSHAKSLAPSYYNNVVHENF